MKKGYDFVNFSLQGRKLPRVLRHYLQLGQHRRQSLHQHADPRFGGISGLHGVYRWPR